MSIDTISALKVDTIRHVASNAALALDVDQRSIAPFIDVSEKIEIGVFERISMFYGHALTPVHAGEIPIPESFRGWFLALLFCGFVVYAWLVSFNMKRVGHVLTAAFGHRGFSRMIKAGDLFSDPLLFPLSVLMILGFSLFGFRIGMEFDLWNMQNPKTLTIFTQVAAGFGLLYLGKVVVIKICAWIFKEQAAAKQYLLNLFAFNTTLVLVFLPLLLMAFFGDVWLQTTATYIMMGLFLIWFVWRGVRSFIETKSLTKFSYVHNFLYFCTLEIGYYLLVYVILRIVFKL